MRGWHPADQTKWSATHQAAVPTSGTSEGVPRPPTTNFQTPDAPRLGLTGGEPEDGSTKSTLLL